METRDHLKNGDSPKNHKSRVNQLMKFLFFIALIVLSINCLAQNTVVIQQNSDKKSDVIVKPREKVTGIDIELVEKIEENQKVFYLVLTNFNKVPISCNYTFSVKIKGRKTYTISGNSEDYYHYQDFSMQRVLGANEKKEIKIPVEKYGKLERGFNGYDTYYEVLPSDIVVSYSVIHENLSKIE